jgi:hypothetical protein
VTWIDFVLVECGPVVVERCRECIRFAEHALDLSDVRRVTIAWRRPVVPKVVDKREVVRGERLLGKIRNLDEPPMKVVVDMFDVEHGFCKLRRVCNRQDDRATDELGPQCKYSVGDDCAPIMADEMYRHATAELPDQFGDICGERAQVVEAIARDLTRWVAAQVRCYSAVSSRGKRRELVAPGVGRVREAMQEEDERPLSLLKIGEVEPIGVDTVYDASSICVQVRCCFSGAAERFVHQPPAKRERNLSAGCAC